MPNDSTATSAAATDWTFGDGGFAKLYGDRLAQSSLLDRDVATRWGFVYMLSQADAQGRYRCASVAGFARAAALTPEQAARCIAELEAPDPDSTTPDHDGRRIVRIPGGWQIVSYMRYREYRTKRQMAAAARKRRQRERDMSRDVTVISAPDVRRQTSNVKEQTTDNGLALATPPREVLIPEVIGPRRARDGRPQRRIDGNGHRETWLTPYMDAFAEVYPAGDFNAKKGAFVLNVRPLDQAHGPEIVASEMVAYLRQTPARFVSWPTFASAFGSWTRQAPGVSKALGQSAEALRAYVGAGQE